MKNIFLLLSLHFVLANAFSQSLNFQENFDNGVFNNAWKITSGKWYIANLNDKRIKPPAGDNNYALASGGNGEIIVDMAAQPDDLEIPLQLSFTYWVHSKGSTGLVNLVFLNDRNETLSTIQFDALQQKDNWNLFNHEFLPLKGTAVIRLIFRNIAAPGRNTMYLKKVYCIGSRREN